MLIPELAESEDERIRNALIKGLNFLTTSERVFTFGDIPIEDIVAYLKKMEVFEQGEGVYLYKDGRIYLVGRHAEEKIQRESLHIPETCKENADSFTDKDERMRHKLIDHLDWHSNNRLTHEECDELRSWLEKQKEQKQIKVLYIPKFRTGDLVRSSKNPRLTYEILGVGSMNELGNPEYEVEIFTDGKPDEPRNLKHIEIEKMDSWGELVEQKPDEIDGKALLHVSNKSYKIGYRDGVDSVKPVEGEFPYNTPADTVEGEIENIWSKLSCENKFTATKTGFREVILHFVNYVRSNAAPEWSEEDRLILDSIIAVVEEWEDTQSDKEKAYYGATTKSDWLKSLRPQPKQEWSEDDEMMVKSIVNVLKRFEHQGATDIKIDWLQNKLKSLRPSWKPSEEQMKALKDASDREFFSGYGATLRVLYSDLKKLI